MEWDYFKPNPSDYCKSASKRYVDARDETTLKTALAKVAELNKEEQADWNETNTKRAGYIKNKPDIQAMSEQANWTETNPASYAYIKNKPTLATVATTGAYNDLTGKPAIPTVPTNVSELVNDANYQTNTQVTSSINSALSGYTPSSGLATVATTGSYDDLTNKPTIPAGAVLYNTTGANTDGAMTQKATTDALSTKANAGDLATVATSGSYTDLTNKPTIPAAQIQSDWNQTTNTAKDYIKNKPTVPVFTLQTTDPGTGGTLAANNFIVVYEA